jgi:glycosidase
MLIRHSNEAAAVKAPVIGKKLYSKDCPEGRDVSRLGAFPASVRLHFDVCVPRRLGCFRVLLRIRKDGGLPSEDIPLRFSASKSGDDLYSVQIEMKQLCGSDGDGLFYYEFLFVCGSEILYSDTSNNVDFSLSHSSGHRFRLLVYRDGFTVPRWFGRKVIYHIFVDRFCKGGGNVSIRDTAIINDDWEHGVPQYGSRPGSEVENNVFFGGNLWGVIEKLDYLCSLGVGAIYLNPVFEAYSNHKYDTGDYEKVDGLFGGDEALCELIDKSAARGIKIILDGVFNHTGEDSRYFNKYGRYAETGAYQSEKSQYFRWYNFRKFPDSYECWWNIKKLPRLNHSCRECREYFAGKDGIGAAYVERGIGGWRLDVADELSDIFLEEFRESVKSASDGEAVIVGEVWENAADKISYGERRKYLRGGQLDSVMNYPLRNGIINFILYRDSSMLYNILTDIYSSYPRCVSDALMNLLGTHDTERILTVLADAGTDTMTNEQLSLFRLDDSRKATALKRLKLAAVIQYTVYGVPSVFYGDEAGIEGGRDPFCRMPFPWGRENAELLRHYRRLGEIREKEAVFDGGDFRVLSHSGAYISYERSRGGEGEREKRERIIIAANSGGTPVTVRLPEPMRDLLSGEKHIAKAVIPPVGAVILK